MQTTGNPDAASNVDAAHQNTVILASVGGLIADVVRDVSGNEISSSLSGQSLTSELAQILVNQEIVGAISSLQNN